MITDPQVRDAFDISREPPQVREGTARSRNCCSRGVWPRPACRSIQVTIDGAGHQLRALGNGWDTHGNNFKQMRGALPEYDQAIAALITDLHDRGLDEDVAMVIWGEFGRTPQDQRRRRPRSLAAGGLHRPGRRRLAHGPGHRRHQRPRRAARSATPTRRKTSSPWSIATSASIPARTTVTDPTGRPHYLLRDPRPIQELI